MSQSKSLNQPHLDEMMYDSGHPVILMEPRPLVLDIRDEQVESLNDAGLAALIHGRPSFWLAL